MNQSILYSFHAACLAGFWVTKFIRTKFSLDIHVLQLALLLAPGPTITCVRAYFQCLPLTQFDSGQLHPPIEMFSFLGVYSYRSA